MSVKLHCVVACMFTESQHRGKFFYSPSLILQANMLTGKHSSGSCLKQHLSVQTTCESGRLTECAPPAQTICERHWIDGPPVYQDT